MKRFKTTLILTISLVITELIGLLWIFLGWTKSSDAALAASRVKALRYFTVDSNILMGIIAVVLLVDLVLIIKKKKEEISKISYILFHVGTVGVTLTMLVTIFFLEPTKGPNVGYFALFIGSNFFLHLFNPTLSIVILLLCLNTKSLKIIHTLYGIIPMGIYSIYYVIAALTHLENGKVMDGYDWYGFLVGGIYFAFLIIPLMLLITYAISFVLYKLNKKLYKD